MDIRKLLGLQKHSEAIETVDDYEYVRRDKVFEFTRHTTEVTFIGRTDPDGSDPEIVEWDWKQTKDGFLLLGKYVLTDDPRAGAKPPAPNGINVDVFLSIPTANIRTFETIDRAKRGLPYKRIVKKKKAQRSRE